MDDDPGALIEELDACAVACEDAFHRLRTERGRDGIGELERDLLLTAAVARTAWAESERTRFEPQALAHLLDLAAELGERTAAALASDGDDRLELCRDACLAAAAAARELAPRTLPNGYG